MVLKEQAKVMSTIYDSIWLIQNREQDDFRGDKYQIKRFFVNIYINECDKWRRGKNFQKISISSNV